MVKNGNMDLNSKLNFFNKELRKKVFKAVAKSYNNEIANHFKEHPTGIGVTLQHFKPLTVDGNQQQETIAIFDRGYPAYLQEGTSFSKYPYNKREGTFISFDKEPNLEEWAKANYKKYDSRMKGLRVGKKGTTAFGAPHNRWVDQAIIRMKSSSQTRSNILREIKSIKLK